MATQDKSCTIAPLTPISW